MPGFEVVGVVLGGIPLIISALEHYETLANTVRIWRRYRREIVSLKGDISTESGRLLNTCERLLEDLDLGSEIDAMIKDPFGHLWKNTQIEHKLRKRLRQDYQTFEFRVREMQGALEEIQKKLGIEPGGNVEWTRGGFFKQGYKRVDFTLNRSRYSEHLAQLNQCNTALETLARQNLDLEPMRKARPRKRFLKLLRSVSNNVYHALRDSLPCRCGHDLGFALSTSQPLEPDKDEDVDIVAEFEFNICVSAGATDSVVWKEILLRPHIEKPQDAAHSVQIGLPKPKIAFKKSVSFQPGSQDSGLQSRSMTMTQTRSTNLAALIVPATIVGVNAAGSTGRFPPQIHDLCVSLFRTTGHTVSHCYGLISDKQAPEFSMFEVHPTSFNAESRSAVTLEEVLKCQDGSLERLNFKRRCKVAFAVSYAVLQLSQTPWLLRSPSSRSISFHRKNGLVDYDQVFIATDPASEACLNTGLTGPDGIIRTRNRILLGLAILLIEIMLQKTFDVLQRTMLRREEAGASDVYASVKAARDLAPMVGNECDRTFGSAIERCVGDLLKIGDLTFNDEGFRQEFYSGVVVLLEDNVKNMDILF